MPFSDLRQFLQFLERKNQLLRIKSEVDTRLEITEVLNRLLERQGPAVIFEKVKGHAIPVVANLFGSVERIALGLDTSVEGLKQIGEFLAFLQHPEPPKGLVDAVKKLPFYRQIFNLTPKKVKKAPCQDVILEGKEVNINKFPILTCWPEDAAPQITWSLVITKPPEEGPANIGIYRMQILDEKRTLMRWLKHHGGAKHYRAWMKAGKVMPVAVAIGTDPGMMVAAVTPVPERMSEFHFAGLLRRKAVDLVDCRTVPLEVPATSEIIIEGEIHPGEEAPEGPHGDHTGYYNAVEPFPIFRIKCITHRTQPLYLTTTTGRPPREDAMTGLALNIIFLPLLRQHFPEVVDFHLPMEGVSYRFAIISMKKEYPGHAKRIMMGLWGFLKQFLYVKFIIVVDDDIDVRNWDDVIWAIATRVDPVRDTTMIDNSPIDYLDFASPFPELGSKMGIDATTKMPPETTREWGKKIVMDPDVVKRVDRLWEELGLH